MQRLCVEQLNWWRKNEKYLQEIIFITVSYKKHLIKNEVKYKRFKELIRV